VRSILALGKASDMVRFQPFQLERIMSEWENVVEYNLSESGAHPATLAELLGD
jgi:hypothetical protein